MDNRRWQYQDQDTATLAPIVGLMAFALYALFSWAMNGGLKQPSFDEAERRPMTLTEARAMIEAESEDSSGSDDPFVFDEDDTVVSPSSVPTSK